MPSSRFLHSLYPSTMMKRVSLAVFLVGGLVGVGSLAFGAAMIAGWSCYVMLLALIALAFAYRDHFVRRAQWSGMAPEFAERVGTRVSFTLAVMLMAITMASFVQFLRYL